MIWLLGAVLYWGLLVLVFYTGYLFGKAKGEEKKK